MAKNVSFRINGARIEDLEKAVLINPGRKNTLTVEIGERPGASIRVVLDILAPDGRKRREAATLSNPGTAELDLGPFAVPAVYEYEAGVVYRCGYRLVVSVIEQGKVSDRLVTRFELYQACTREENAESLFFGSKRTVEYNDGWIPEGKTWFPFGYSGRPMDPPVDFRLGPEVLVDQNAVEVRFRLRHESPELGPIEGIIVARDGSGKEVLKRQKVLAEAGWKNVEVEVSKWKSGAYEFEFYPEIEGKVYGEGPVVKYRRNAPDPDDVFVSPLVPFKLKRDPGRPEWRIDDWRFSRLPDGWIAESADGASEEEPVSGWKIIEEDGTSALQCKTDEPRNSLILAPKLVGTYAIFLKPAGSVYIDVGDGLFRPVSDQRGRDAFTSLPIFISVGDLTEKKIEIMPTGAEVSGIEELHLIPVGEESVRRFTESTQHPPLPLRGISDWWCYLRPEMTRLEEDLFDTIIAGQREVGLSSANWAVGRSWVTYHSRLPRASIFPCKELPEARLPDFPAAEVIRRMVNDFDALGYPLKKRSEFDMRLSNWLGMNRHYRVQSRGGTHTSPWVLSHPELNLRFKNTDRSDLTRVEFFFEEARRERIDIFVESAGYDTDGVVVGWCRQPPHAGYHPEMVEEYRKRTGSDPRQLDHADGDSYRDWLKWRCEKGTTRLMRDLRKALAELEKRTGRRIPILVRVPSGGFLFDRAMGLDTETWIREGLIDELQLDPQENRCCGFGSHDVRPYLELCRRHGTPVFGGVNGITGTGPISGLSAAKDASGPIYSPAVGIKRAIGLIRAGVDGIEVYESEQFAHMSHVRWLIPLWGNAEFAEKFLNESNIEAVYPVTASNAACGHDNHWTPGHSVYGIDQLPRGAARLV